MGEPREFSLDDVVVIAKSNDCPSCKVRVDTYLNDMVEWQNAYDTLKVRCDGYKRILEAIAEYDPNKGMCLIMPGEALQQIHQLAVDGLRELDGK